MRPRTDPAGRTWVPVADDFARSWRDVRWQLESLLPDDYPGDWELEWRVRSPGDTADTGWHLYGDGIFGEFLSRKLTDALAEADRWISGDIYTRH